MRGCLKKGHHKKFWKIRLKAKKRELRAEKQQVYHMGCHGSVSCIYPDRGIDS